MPTQSTGRYGSARTFVNEMTKTATAGTIPKTTITLRPSANEMLRVDRRPKTKEFNIRKDPFCNGLDEEEVGPTNVAGRTPALQCPARHEDHRFGCPRLRC